MRLDQIFQCFRGNSDNDLLQKQEGRSDKYQIFRGNDKYFIDNGKVLLEERISLFDGVWDGNSVMVKGSYDDYSDQVQRKHVCREIAVASQMASHSYAHRLLGCCLFTDLPVLVYSWVNNGTLHDRILKYKEQSNKALEWKDRLRIASEIAHTVAYLHTAFRQPIVHRSLTPMDVFLDQDDSARLSGFGFSISIPKGKKHVDDIIMGTYGYVAPEYMAYNMLAKSADVFSFGALLLVLLTGKVAYVYIKSDPEKGHLSSWVRDCHAAKKLGDVVDPAITIDEHFENHLQEFVELALNCLSNEEEDRPTMVEVATELNNMITSTSHPV